MQKGKTAYTPEEQQAIEADQAAAYDSFKPYKDPGWDSYWQSNPEWVGIRGAQATKYASGSGAGFAQDTSLTPEDRMQYGRYVDQLQDLRKSFDFMQDYRYSDVGQMQTSNHGENELGFAQALARAQQRRRRPHRDLGPTYGEQHAERAAALPGRAGDAVPRG